MPCPYFLVDVVVDVESARPVRWLRLKEGVLSGISSETAGTPELSPSGKISSLASRTSIEPGMSANSSKGTGAMVGMSGQEHAAQDKRPFGMLD